MLFAVSAYSVGQIVGVAILIAVLVGVTRTLIRSDLSWKEKIFGESRAERVSDGDKNSS